MKYRCKYTLLKRSKKYDYKVYEEQTYNDICGYEYSFYIMNYNETDTLISGIVNWADVEKFIRKLEEKKNGNN